MEKGIGLNMYEEFNNIDFNSKRLEQWFVRTTEISAGQPDKSLWLCGENRAEAKAMYRLLADNKLDREETLRTHREAALRRIGQCEKTVLAIQDTTCLNYDYVNDKTLGINIHTCLAVTTDGQVLGLLSQSSYNREYGKKSRLANLTHDSRKTRPLEEKESFRWVSCLEESTEGHPKGAHIVTVCDREGDMYELFDAAEQAGQSFLIRIVQNRKTVENQKIIDAIQEKFCMGKIAVTIPRDSRNELPERDAVLQMRYDRFTIKRPRIRDANKRLRTSLELTVIHVREEIGTELRDPLEWFLITNEEVFGVEEAYEKVRWYMMLLKIEQFHYILKSGYKIEKLQVRSIEKTTTRILMYSIITAAIMNLMYAGRVYPESPCTLFFEDDEWKLLYCTANKTKTAPSKPYTIADAVKYLGRLVSPKSAPSDDLPEVRTILIGLEKFNTLLALHD